MKTPASSLAPMLRSDTQGRILARLLVDPESEHSLTDLATGAGTSFPTVQREIERAERAGFVTTRRVGQAKLVRADTGHPLHDAVRRLILATYGPPAIVAEEFGRVEGVNAVVLFGSWAARYLGAEGRAPHDVDVLVIGDPDRDAVDDAAERAEHSIGMAVQATVRTRDEWGSDGDSFVAEVKRRPLVPVLVDPDDEVLAAELERLWLRGARRR